MRYPDHNANTRMIAPKEFRSTGNSDMRLQTKRPYNTGKLNTPGVNPYIPAFAVSEMFHFLQQNLVVIVRIPNARTCSPKRIKITI